MRTNNSSTRAARSAAIARALLFAMTLTAGACGSVIEGEVIGDRGLPSHDVLIFRDPDAIAARCSALAEAYDRGIRARLAFEDSVRRVTGAIKGGPRQVDMRIDFNLEQRAWGDPAASIIAERDSIIDSMSGGALVWLGETDGDGRFETPRLPPAEYRVEVAGFPTRVQVGRRRVQITIRHPGAEYPRGCHPEHGKLL